MSHFWSETPRRAGYAQSVLTNKASISQADLFALNCEFSAQGFVEPFIEQCWGPLISEPELLSGVPGLFLDQWQWDAVTHFNSPTFARVSVSGSTGTGKNLAAALALIVYYYSRSPSKLVITRDTFEAAVTKAWGEVDRWLRLMKYRPHGRITGGGLHTSSQHFISVANPQTNEGFSGLHSETGSVAMWFDEATSIPQSRFDDASAQTDKLLITFNPRVLSGPSREAFPAGRDANTTGTRQGPQGLERFISVSGDSAENFPCANIRLKRLQRALGPIGGIEIDGRRFDRGEEIPPELYAMVKPLVPGQTCYDTWLGLGANERTRRVFAFGFFPEESADFQVVLGSWIDAAASRWKRWHRAMRRASGKPLPGDQSWRVAAKVRPNLAKTLDRLLPIRAVGLDVAGSDDGDDSVMAIGSWHGCRELLSFKSADLTQVADWCERSLIERGVLKSQVTIGVDADGIGQGVANILQRSGWRVTLLRGGDRPTSKRWENARCERVGSIGERLDPAGEFPAEPFALPPDAMLREELTAYEKFGANKDQTVLSVTPKRGQAVKITAGDTVRTIEPIVSQLKRSPDRADAVGYMLAVSRRGGSVAAWIDSL